MASLTELLPFLLSTDADPSKTILSHGGGLQVVRVYAEPISAQVVKSEPVRDRTFGQFVSSAMGENGVIDSLCSLVPEPKRPVSSSLFGTCPKPAPVRLIDLRPESKRHFWSLKDRDFEKRPGYPHRLKVVRITT